MKLLKSIGVMLLVLILLCGVAFGVGWGVTGTYDVTKWFKTEPAEGEPGGDVTDGDSTAVALSSKIVAYSIDGYESSEDNVFEDGAGNVAITYSDKTDTCVINVTVLDKYGYSPSVLQSVTWSLSDESAGLSMAANGTSATFLVGEYGFNKQIFATCTSNLNDDLSLTFTFDCAYRYYNVIAFENNSSVIHETDDSAREWYIVPGNSSGRIISKLVADRDSGTVGNRLLSLTGTVTPTEELSKVFSQEGYKGKLGSYSFESRNLRGTADWETADINIYLSQMASAVMNISPEAANDEYWSNRFYDCVTKNTFNYNGVWDFEVEITATWQYGGVKTYTYYVDYIATANDITSDRDDTNITL